MKDMVMGDGKLKVMQIIRNLDIGGAQEVVRTLAEYLAEEGCVPMVCPFAMARCAPRSSGWACRSRFCPTAATASPRRTVLQQICCAYGARWAMLSSGTRST